MVELNELIQHAREMKPLPASAIRLAALINSPHVDLNDVADIIDYDQALTMRLLRAANSAAVGGSERLTRASEAVFRLGLPRVLSLAIASSVRDPFQRDVAAYGLAEGELWRHSVATAAAAETLFEVARCDLPSETFTAALLHDIGKLVMGRHLSTEDLEWIHRARIDGGLSALEAERQILDVHHGELGGIIAQHWEMPERVVKAIIYHHTPTDGFDVICDAVNLANLVAKSIAGAPLPTPAAESLERLGITADELEPLVATTQKRFQDISARYNAV